jgi:uncharacterized DUF497 family protein
MPKLDGARVYSGIPGVCWIYSPDHSIGPARWITFGESARGRLLAVAHVEEGDIIRVISARVATRHEKRFYEEA